MNNILYGCMHLGGSWTAAPLSAKDRTLAYRSIESALEAGFSRFDHADIYALGKSEQVFGDYLALHPGLRERITIQSKAGIVLPDMPGGSNRYCHSRDYLLHQVEQSLKRLRCDYLDTFLVHRPDPLTHPADLADTLMNLHQRGWIRQVGVSNYSPSQVEALQHYLPLPLVANQVQFSLGHRYILEREVLFNSPVDPPGQAMELLSSSRDANITIQAWSPLDKGRYLDDKAVDPLIQMVRDQTNRLAEKYACAPLAILLAWVRKLGITPVFGSRQPERIHAASSAMQVNLSDTDWYDLWVLARGEALP